LAQLRLPSAIAALSVLLSGQAVALPRPWLPIPRYELSDSLATHMAELARVPQTQLPGTALVLLRDGQPILTRYRGVESLERKTPISGETRFYIASLAKTITATATLMLLERGALRLEDSVGRWIADLPACARDVRIIHLLQHTSGLPDYFDAFGDTARDVDNERVLGFVRKLQALEFRPGERYAYSNTGYVLLAEVIGRASGRSYADFVKDSVLTPLGMTRTVVVRKSMGEIPHRAVGYRKEGERFVADDVRDHWALGGGGIYSTLDDVVTWYRSVVSSRLIRPANTALIFDTPTTLSGRRSYLGMGWSDETPGPKTPALEGLRAYGSFGMLRGFSAAMLFYPDQQFAWIALSNVAEGALPPPKFMERVFRQVQ